MTRIEELDAVLKHMQTLPDKYTWLLGLRAELNNIGILIPPDDLQAILNKLLNDGYISDDKELVRSKSVDGVPLPWIKEATYVLTWEGMYFYEEGGYAGERFRSESEVKSKKIMANTTFILTLLAAVGTFGLLLFEIYKWKFHDH